MSYAALTRQDANPVKRWLQEQRLRAALALVDPAQTARVLDYGGGDGELAARLAARWPRAEVLCFEPAAPLRAEAAERLAGSPRARLAAEEADLPSGWAETALCLEVMEHLPPEETERALDELHRCLAPGGRLICGVPVEIGPPALAKGLFRRSRRHEDFDGRGANIAVAALGRPPKDRPLQEFSPGRAYYPHHLGFDHRRLRKQLARRFRLLRTVGSPFGTRLSLINAELYIVAARE